MTGTRLAPEERDWPGGRRTRIEVGNVSAAPKATVAQPMKGTLNQTMREIQLWS